MELRGHKEGAAAEASKGLPSDGLAWTQLTCMNAVRELQLKQAEGSCIPGAVRELL